MMHMYVLAVQGLSAEKEKGLATYLEKRGYGWWHWIENFWIIVTYSEENFSQKLIDLINEDNAHRIFLLQVHPEKKWHGVGPATDDKNMFEWLEENLKNV